MAGAAFQKLATCASVAAARSPAARVVVPLAWPRWSRKRRLWWPQRVSRPGRAITTVAPGRRRGTDDAPQTLCGAYVDADCAAALAG